MQQQICNGNNYVSKEIKWLWKIVVLKVRHNKESHHFSRIIYCLILAEFQSCVGLWKRDETYFLIPAFDRSDLVRTMPVRSITNEMDVVPALAPIKSKQPGVTNSLLYSGSRFVGHQKSKGNQYDVEVILQVRNKLFIALRKVRHTREL